MLKHPVSQSVKEVLSALVADNVVCQDKVLQLVIPPVCWSKRFRLALAPTSGPFLALR